MKQIQEIQDMNQKINQIRKNIKNLYKTREKVIKSLHEKQHFRKNAQRKYHILLIFRN